MTIPSAIKPAVYPAESSAIVPASLNAPQNPVSKLLEHPRFMGCPKGRRERVEGLQVWFNVRLAMRPIMHAGPKTHGKVLSPN
jgi:hypothetical protein